MSNHTFWLVPLEVSWEPRVFLAQSPPWYRNSPPHTADLQHSQLSGHLLLRHHLTPSWRNPAMCATLWTEEYVKPHSHCRSKKGHIIMVYWDYWKCLLLISQFESFETQVPVNASRLAYDPWVTGNDLKTCIRCHANRKPQFQQDCQDGMPHCKHIHKNY